MEQAWINHPTILKGSVIDLIPLEKEHLESLYKAACDKELWELIPTDCSIKEKFDAAYEFALTERDMGRQYPFVIVLKSSGEFIGSTRLFELFPKHRKLEIGWTWITKAYWGSSVNLECKYLLLQFCFEQLRTVRVQFKTRDTNIRSRKAIEKLGASFEGILRQDRIHDDGTIRNAAYYSILDTEWVDARQKIQQQLEKFR